MKIPLKRIMNPEFSNAYLKLMKSQVPVSAAYKLRKIASTIVEAQDMYDSMRRELLEKYGSKNKKGELIVDDSGNVKMTAAQREQFNKAHEELLNVEVECGSIEVKELGNINMSAHELILLEHIIV